MSRDNDNIETSEDLIKKQKEQKRAIDELRKTLKELSGAKEKENKQNVKLSEQLKGLIKSEVEFNTGLTNSVHVLKDLLKVRSLFSLAETAKEMLIINSELHRTVVNAGNGAEALKAYKKTAVELSTAMGATHEDANKVVKKLAELQYLGTPKEINEAARASYGLARAFGLNYEEISANTVELQKWGQVSSKTTTAMYTDVMKVAQATGLTKNGVTAIMKTTTNWSGMLKAFGKTAPMDVQNYNMSLAKTVSALEKVGVSAQTSTKLLEDLTDPTMIEKNIPKYAALGISITDAISGNIDPEQMGAGLKEFGEKLKQMGPIAGAQYAEAMGVSYKEAIKAASADMAEASKVDMTPEEKSMDQMMKLTDATKDMTERMMDGVQKIGGEIRKLGPIALLIVSAIIPTIMKKFTKSGKEVADEIANGAIDSSKTASKEIQDEIKNLGKVSVENAADVAKIAAEEFAKQDKNRFERYKEYRRDAGKIAFDDEVAAGKKLKELENQRLSEKLIETEKAFYKEAEYEQKLLDNKEEMIKKFGKKEYEEKLKRSKSTLDKLSKLEEKYKNRKLKLDYRDWNKAANQAKKEIMNSFSFKIGEKLGKLKMLPMAPIKFIGARKFGQTIIRAGNAMNSAFKKVGNSIADKISKIKLGIKSTTKPGASFGNTLKNIGKTLGIASIGLMLLSKLIQPLQKPLDDLMNKVMKFLQPVFDVLAPILTNLLGSLVKNLLPPVLKILSAMLAVLGFILTPLRLILKGLSKLPGMKFLGDIADTIEEVTGPKLRGALNDAANNISNSNNDLTDATEKNTGAIESKKEQVFVSSDGKMGVSKVQKGTSTTSSSEETDSNSSTSTSVVDNSNQVNGFKELKETFVELKQTIERYMQTQKEKDYSKEINGKLNNITAALNNGNGLNVNIVGINDDLTRGSSGTNLTVFGERVK